MITHSAVYTEMLKLLSSGETQYTNKIYASLTCHNIVRENTDQWTLWMHIWTDPKEK